MAYKALVVIGSLELGGTERHLCQIIPEINGSEFEIEVVAFRKRGRLASEIEDKGVKVRSPQLPLWIERRRIFLTLAIFLWMGRLFLKERPHIVHTFLPEAYLIAGLWAAILRIPVRIMSRRSLNDYQRKRRAFTHLEHWLHRYMHLLIGNSMSVANNLACETHDGTKRIRTIYNGIDVKPFVSSVSRNEMRSMLRVPNRALLFCTVANLIPYKGHVDLLQAFSHVAESLPSPWRWMCIGYGAEFEAYLKVLAEELGIGSEVMWLGSRSDIPELLTASDIGILPSHEEGLPNAILEMMVSRLPVIATNVGGIPEIIVDQRTGMLVPPKQPKLLADAILALARDPVLQSKMGEAGRVRVEKEFTLDSCLAEYRKVYSEVIQDQRRG